MGSAERVEQAVGSSSTTIWLYVISGTLVTDDPPASPPGGPACLGLRAQRGARVRRHEPVARRRPLNIAHQGGEDEFPSNTMYAFERSLQVGADMLELDVGVTKDGQVVVMHDTTVDRTTNGHGHRRVVHAEADPQARRRLLVLRRRRRLPPRPRALGLSRSAAWRPASASRPKGFTAADFRVPTLNEVLSAFPHTPINIEIKGRTKAEALDEYVTQRRGARADC